MPTLTEWDRTPRIVVDAARCEGHGMCVGVAPDVFALHDEGAVEVLTDTADAVETAATAAIACPVGAIRVAS